MTKNKKSFLTKIVVASVIFSTILTTIVMQSQSNTYSLPVINCSNPIKIMATGDSITEGIAQYYPNEIFDKSYRFPLLQKLKQNGYRVDFVGTKNGFYNTPNTDPNFDADHQGYGGNRTDELLQNLRQTQAITLKKPDVVILMIGTNDVNSADPSPSNINNQKLANSLNYFKDIVNLISPQPQPTPNTSLIVSHIPPAINGMSSRQPNVNFFNLKITEYISSISSNLRVSITNLDTLTTADMMQDGIHPNQLGASKMADKYYQKLIELNIFKAQKQQCGNIPNPIIPPTTQPLRLLRRDFNYDNKTDIIWRNKASGQNIVWYMDGKNFKSGSQNPTGTDYEYLTPVADLNWRIRSR